MTWISELITDGEIDALRLVASQAWGDDTQYPLWRESNSFGGGQCYVTSAWLQSRLGGFIGRRDGHFAWLSPDRSYVLDLTGDHSGPPVYAPNDGYERFEFISNERCERFSKRANLLFDNLDRVIKIATDGAGGDAFPGQEPQRANDIDDQYYHDEPAIDPEDTEYKFFFADDNLEIAPSKDFDHDELKEHHHLDDNYDGPMAVGYVILNNNSATWQVDSNIDHHSLMKKLKDYNKHFGWEWNGMTSIDGEPIHDDFGPDKKSKVMNYVWSDNHLYIGRLSHSALAIKANTDVHLTGTIEIMGNTAKVEPVYMDALEALFEWSTDQGLTLYGSSNNVVKRIPDMELKNLGNPDGPLTNPVEQDAEDDTPLPQRTENGVITCPKCGVIFGSNDDYQEHRREEHGHDEEVQFEDGKMKDIPDMDKPAPFNNLTPYQPDGNFPVEGSVKVIVVPSYREASRVDGFNKYAKAFKFNDHGNRFYVSYLNGSPVGYAVIARDGEIRLIQSSVKNQSIATSMLSKIEKHYPQIYAHILHDWEAPYLSERGWVNAKGRKWVRNSAKEPKDLLEASIPFVYDIAADTLNTGMPGQRTSDVPGNFTPGGIVEGEYGKGGKVVIYTMTNMPYSVNHLLSLWYNTYPEMTIKNVFLQEDDGTQTKLANGRN